MKNSAAYFIFILLYCSGISAQFKIEVVVSNPVNFDRSIETIGIPAIDLQTEGVKIEDILVKDANNNILVRQLIDLDQDGTVDELLFQTQLNANEKKTFYLEVVANRKDLQPKSDLTTYSRIVPERTDDYTWENDRVAFRTFGMEAQRLVEEKKAGGTLSSGIDLWLKRVDYSIIDKWYKDDLESKASYHVDHGEGYDPYHVGKSRGTGGIGVWKDDTLHTSKNFIAYRTIAKGPIRTVFELDYAPWSDFGIKETKRISLDLGSSFSKFEISLQASDSPPNYTIGITRHDGKGQSSLKADEGWIRHWETMDDSYVGEGIVLDPNVVLKTFLHESDISDQSQLFIVTKPDSKLTYYAGFAWQKSGQVKGVEDWDEQLKRQALMVKHPLKIEIE